MDTINFKKYLSRHHVDTTPLDNNVYNPDMIVVIPCYDEPYLNHTLESLYNASDTSINIEVIVVINSGEQTSDDIVSQNRETYQACLKLATKWEGHLILTPVIHENLRRKHAGAGYARKLGLDLAVARFLANHRVDGILISLDADTLVQSNYFTAIYNSFKQQVGLYGAVISFEHPLNDCNIAINSAIAHYELHLRYVNLCLKASGFPYAHHTVGSAFAVSAAAYVKHGGMNRRQGGEDFYFLHKLFPHGEFVELNTTCVFPSARPSHRVPFGTGPQIRAFIEDGHLTTYTFETFLALKELFDHVGTFYSSDNYSFLPSVIQSFLEQYDFVLQLNEIRSNVASKEAFIKRFFVFFNAFTVVKYLNFAHQRAYVKSNVVTETVNLLEFFQQPSLGDVFLLLSKLREIEKSI